MGNKTRERNKGVGITTEISCSQNVFHDSRPNNWEH